MILSSTEVPIYDAVMREEQQQQDELGGLFVPRSTINAWRLIPTAGITNEKSKRMAYRLNSFANCFYFGVQVLGKRRFQLNPDLRKNLHFQMCMIVMKDGLKEVIEIPRDHYKSTVYSEVFPIWRALPFGDEDEHYMRVAGVSDLYIKWMRRAHNRDIKILIVSEVSKNAVKLGIRTRAHYDHNKLFRELFPEVIPDASCIWTNESLHQKRTVEGSVQGEGTFDFIGVGGALQSTHYDMVIEDDLVGKEALKSETVMNDTIDYHKLLAGATDSDVTNAGRDFDEIVVGNRWSYKDLNSHIRAEEPYFNFITHSALGGCCELHPYGTPIFPEAFTLAKLERYKRRFGIYYFSCQYLNFPVNPEKCKFELKNIRYFNYVADESGSTFIATEKRPVRVKIRHHVVEGDVEEDVFPRNLHRFMIVDPNHSGAKGRCRHAITITGVRQDKRRIYLLYQWAKACAIEEFVTTIFRRALQFKITTIHLETVAAQKYLKFHLEYFIIVNKNKKEWEGIGTIDIADLKSANTENAKDDRIDSFIPITERKEFWMDADNCSETREEMQTHGNRGALKDILDTLGYGPQIWKFEEQDEDDLKLILNSQQQRFVRAMSRI